MGPKNDDKKAKKKSKNKQNGDKAALITDERFAAVHSDPRFQNVPKRKSKVAIDSRFDRMFTDKNFASSSARVDKHGRPRKSKPGESLKHYYRIDEDEEEVKAQKICEAESGSEESEKELGKIGGSDSSELEGEDGESSESGGSESGAESDSTMDTDEGEDVEYEFQHEEEDDDDGEDELQEDNVPTIEKETHRLAIVNLDWRNVSAADLYVVLSSFLPNSGQILSVTVYPSDFGIQRMKEEEVHGPVGLFDDKKNEDDEGEDEDDNDEIDNEKLRAYERSRLRYYYAVVECDSVATADYLYNSCDGVEFERSSNVLDLRFVPDSMDFKHPPRDVCKEAPTSYEGLDFHTRALQHSNIHLTWDEDEPHRVKTLNRKFNADQLADLELKEFLASDESESDDDEDDEPTEDEPAKKVDKRDKYRALIQSGNESDEGNEENDQDMEVTFNTGLEDLSKRILEKKDKKQETVWESHLRKQREKKKARKNKSKYSSDDDSSESDEEPIGQPDDFFIDEPTAKRSKKDIQGKSSKRAKKHQDTDGEAEAEASRAELELLLADDNDTGTDLKGYNLKRKKSKGKKGKEMLEEDKIPTVDCSDPRFSALFTSPDYALDPTDPQYKRSAAYARQVVQKQQKRDHKELEDKTHMNMPAQEQLPSDLPGSNKDDHTNSNALPSKKEKYELSSLVRSIKNKTKQVQLSSAGKTLKKDYKQQSGGKAVKEVRPETVQSAKKKRKVEDK